MSNIVKRLSTIVGDRTFAERHCATIGEAIDTIERLERELAEARSEEPGTPRGRINMLATNAELFGWESTSAQGPEAWLFEQLAEARKDTERLLNAINGYIEGLDGYDDELGAAMRAATAAIDAAREESE